MSVSINRQRELLLLNQRFDRVNAREVLEHLKEKASMAPLERKEEYYIIFAKGFRKKITEDNVILDNLKDLEQSLL